MVRFLVFMLIASSICATGAPEKIKHPNVNVIDASGEVCINLTSSNKIKVDNLYIIEGLDKVSKTIVRLIFDKKKFNKYMKPCEVKIISSNTVR